MNRFKRLHSFFNESRKFLSTHTYASKPYSLLGAAVLCAGTVSIGVGISYCAASNATADTDQQQKNDTTECIDEVTNLGEEVKTTKKWHYYKGYVYYVLS